MTKVAQHTKGPATWYRVSKWNLVPQPADVLRETEKMLFLSNGNRELKRTSYEQWFPTLEEAQTVIDARKARERANKELDRIRDAAPGLLKIAAIFLGHDDRFQIAVGGNPIAVDAMLDEARAIYAKATGAS